MWRRWFEKLRYEVQRLKENLKLENSLTVSWAMDMGAVMFLQG